MGREGAAGAEHDAHALFLPPLPSSSLPSSSDPLPNLTGHHALLIPRMHPSLLIPPNLTGHPALLIPRLVKTN